MMTGTQCQRLVAGAIENRIAGRLAACYRLSMQTAFQSVDDRNLHFRIVELPEQQPVRLTIVKATRS
jgi:hypothetical protein